jgi:hypothetical protein
VIEIAGGVGDSVCVDPVIVVFAVLKQFEVACGHTVSCHCDPTGEIALFDGIETE